MAQQSAQVASTGAGSTVSGPSAFEGNVFAITPHPSNASTVWYGQDASGLIDADKGYPLVVGDPPIIVQVAEPSPNASYLKFYFAGGSDKVCIARLS